MMFDKMDEYNKEFLANKQLAGDSNLQGVINYLARVCLSNPALGLLSPLITNFIILGFMAGRETAKREMALRAFVSAESEDE